MGKGDREEIPVIYFISVASFQFPAPKLATESRFGPGNEAISIERVVKADGRESASMGSPPGGGVSDGDYCGCRRRYTQRRVSRDPRTGQFDCASVHTRHCGT